MFPFKYTDNLGAVLGSLALLCCAALTPTQAEAQKAPGLISIHRDKPLRPAIEAVGLSSAGFVGLANEGPLNEPYSLESWEEFTALFGPPQPSLANPHLAAAVYGFFENGGRRAYVVRAAADQEESYLEALDILAQVEELGLMSIPGVANGAVQQSLIDHCERRRDCFALLDGPANADLDAVLDLRHQLVCPSGFAALYHPWLQVEIEEHKYWVPPSGLVAGVFARVDQDEGVFAAPAGSSGQLWGAVDLQTHLGNNDIDLLNPLGINTIRSLPGQGILIWGARTLSSDPEWKYVSVRRYSSFLEQSIGAGTRWAVFEPNDEPLWAQLRQQVSDFLDGQWRSGALQGARPEAAYFVKCGRDTMTPADIEAGKVVILVGFAPLKPAEFLLLNLVQTRDGFEMVD